MRAAYEGTISSGAGDRCGGGAAGEGLSDVELIKVQSEEDDVWVCSTDGVDALHEGRSKMNKLLFVLHLPVPE